MRRLVMAIVLGGIKLYRWAISPMLHVLIPNAGCRYYPSCSRYAEITLRTFPLHRAFFLIGKRLLRCHPFAPGGIDLPRHPHHKG